MRKFKVVKGGLLEEVNSWFNEKIMIPIYIEPSIKKTIINNKPYLCFPLVGVEVILNRNNNLILRKTAKNNSSVKIFINPRQRNGIIGFMKFLFRFPRRPQTPVSSYQLFITGQHKYTVTFNTYKGDGK